MAFNQTTFRVPAGTTHAQILTALLTAGSQATIAQIFTSGQLVLNVPDAPQDNAEGAAPDQPAAALAAVASLGGSGDSGASSGSASASNTGLLLAGLGAAALAFVFLRGSRPAMRPAFGAMRRLVTPSGVHPEPEHKPFGQSTQVELNRRYEILRDRFDREFPFGLGWDKDGHRLATITPEWRRGGRLMDRMTKALETLHKFHADTDTMRR